MENKRVYECVRERERSERRGEEKVNERMRVSVCEMRIILSESK